MRGRSRRPHLRRSRIWCGEVPFHNGHLRDDFCCSGAKEVAPQYRLVDALECAAAGGADAADNSTLAAMKVMHATYRCREYLTKTVPGCLTSEGWKNADATVAGRFRHGQMLSFNLLPSDRLHPSLLTGTDSLKCL